MRWHTKCDLETINTSMKNPLIPALSVLLVSALACRGGENDLRRDEQRYEVVQEGAGGAVTSTLGGVDAVPPLTPSMTGTNADTTTAFTLPATATTAVPAQPGTLAGTLPPAPRETEPVRPPVETAKEQQHEESTEQQRENAPADEPPPPPPPPSGTVTSGPA